MAAIVFPSNPAAQSPTNTFSPTSVPANTYNSYTYTWNGTAWTSSAAGGGGGTVTGVTASLPLASSGGTAPVISATLATAIQAAAGTSNVVLSTPEFTVPKDASGMAGAALLPGSAAAYAGTPATGMIRYNNSTPPAVIEYYNGSGWVAVGTPATLAEAATGTVATKFLSPQTGVPKDASGMTGAAILPSGTDLQRAAIATPVAGMTRFNTDYAPESLEVYNGTSWNQLAYVPDLGTLTDLIPTNGSTLPAAGTYENIIINAGITVNVPAACSLKARTSVQINGTISGAGVGSIGGNGGASTNGVATGGNYGQGLGTNTRSYGFATTFVGSGGSGGGASTGIGTNAIAGPAGNSGGTVIFECDGPITVGSTAIISAAGANAAAGFAGGFDFSLGGGGGGSGGLILLQSNQSLTLDAGAALAVNGGNGFSGSVSGTLTDAGGGGGGGGGYIVLNAPVVSDSSTKNLAGGAGGITAVTGAGVAGGFGAGFGGAGGLGSVSAANGGAGSSGLVLINAYI